MHFPRRRPRAVLRLTHDGRARNHQRLKLGDIIDVAETKWFVVSAVENANVIPWYTTPSNVALRLSD